jgi:hypothetical protein
VNTYPIQPKPHTLEYLRKVAQAPVRGAGPLRQKRAHALRPASRADRRLDPRIWLHQPGADRRRGRHYRRRCFGGWVAAEMMVRSTARFSRLVLVDPLGIKISGREERDIADMHALPRAEYLKLAWADPAKGDLDFTNLPESELAGIVRGREAFALYGWKPYMHNPRLKRWLHRIDLPTLLL